MTDANPADAHKWGTMAAIGLGVLMATLDMSIVNVSLPTLVQRLDTDFPTIQWVIIVYVLVVTSLTLGVGRLGDMWGKKKLYSVGLALFTLASLLCGLAPSVGWLIASRALQGVGAVMMQALGAAIITEVFPSSQRGLALGTVGGIVSTGLALGPAIGGILIGFWGWRSIFLVNVPLGLVTGGAVWRYVRVSPTGRPGQRFDLLGAIIMLISLTCYALGLTMGQQGGFGRPPVLVSLALAGVGFVAFIRVERRTAQPMIDLKLFRDTVFSLNLLMGFLVFVMLASTFLLPFYLELVKDFPTPKVGLMMMAVPVSMGLVAPWAGRLSDRYGSRGISLLGLAVMAGGCLAVGTLNEQVGVLGYILRVAPVGLGMGLFQSPNNSAIMGRAPREHLGVVSSLMVLGRTLGHTTGLPLMGTIFSHLLLAGGNLPITTHITEAPTAAVVYGLTRTVLLAGVLILVALILGIHARRLRDRDRRGALDRDS